MTAIKSSKAGDTTKLALELLFLTAPPSGEIRNARWDEFSLDISLSSPFPARSVLAVRMKAKLAHTVPSSIKSSYCDPERGYDPF